MLRPDGGEVCAPMGAEAKRQAVLACLDGVMDPELDQSVAEMGFVHRIDVDGSLVAIDFRLPTFWCSANFAFLMAEDMRVAVEGLDWVTKAEIALVDHFAANAINRGVAENLPFSAVFADEANGNLAAIRRTFREKAYLGRQEALLRPLVRKSGVEAALSLRVEDLSALCESADTEIAAAARRYVAARRHDGGRADADAPAFTDLDGNPILPARYAAHLREIRSVRGAAQANAEMCRMYLAARYAEDTSVETLEKKRETSA